MAVKASSSITISFMVDIKATYRYYKLQSSTAAAPSVPTSATPSTGAAPSGWSSAEPTYSSGSTNSLYFVDLTIFTNNEWKYSVVSKSSSYEAAKEAWNKANAAQSTANTAKNTVDNLKVGGRNLLQLNKWIKGNWDLGTGVLNTDYNGRVSYSDYVEVTPNETYCTQMFFKNGKSAGILCRGFDSNKKYVISLAPMNKVYKIPSNIKYLVFTIYDNIVLDDILNGNIRIKFEKGTKPTDWTPAPEDVDSNINKVQTNLDDTNSRVDDTESRLDSNDTLIQENNEAITGMKKNLSDNYYDKNDIDNQNKTFTDDIIKVSNRLEKAETESQAIWNFKESIEVNGVQMLDTQTGITMDKNGVTIDENNTPTKNTLNSEGMTIRDKTGSTEKEILFAGYDEDEKCSVVRTDNLSVKTYFTNCEVMRYEKYEDETYGKALGRFFVG